MNLIRKFTPIVVSIFFVLLLFSVYQNYTKLRQAREIISEASREVSELESKKSILQKQLESAEKDIFVEQKVRNELGLSKEGEYVLVLPEENLVRSLAPNIDQQTEHVPLSNLEKWRLLFF